MHHVDFLVIGSGPAGQKAAIQAAKLGKKTVVVEKGTKVGGVTVHTGTIPSKTLREAVLYLSGWRQRSFYGQSYRLKRDISIEDLTERLEHTMRHEIEVIRDQLHRNGVRVVDGSAAFVDARHVRVTARTGEVIDYDAEKILVATGTKPNRPDGVPMDGVRVIDSDDLLRIQSLPRSMTVIGGGVIGIEYATIFNALDVKVAVVDGRREILSFLDPEIVSDLKFHLRDRGVVLRLGEEVLRIDTSDPRTVVTHLASGKQLRSEIVLYAAGRMGNTAELGLANAGLRADHRGLLEVDERFRTSQPNIYAAGDVVGFPSLASTSMEQGRLAACHAFGHTDTDFPKTFPYGIYAVPEISMVGVTESELVSKGIPYETGTARFRETARGQIMGVERGILKILFGLEDRKVLGVHILGEGATELIHIGQVAIALGGTLDYFVDSIFNYPTLAEAYKIASLDAWNRMPRLESSVPRAQPTASSSIPASIPASITPERTLEIVSGS